MQKQHHAPALPRRKELAKAARLAAIKRAAESMNRSNNERSGNDCSGSDCISSNHSGNDRSNNDHSSNAYSNNAYSNNDYSRGESSRIRAEAQPPGPSGSKLKEASADIPERRALAKRAGAS